MLRSSFVGVDQEVERCDPKKSRPVVNYVSLWQIIARMVDTKKPLERLTSLPIVSDRQLIFLYELSQHLSSNVKMKAATAMCA